MAADRWRHGRRCECAWVLTRSVHEQKREAPTSPAGQAPEIAVGSGLSAGMSEVELENICRLQYARWSSEQEYVSAVGSPPELWPDSGLYKSTKKKGQEDRKFYWKRAPEWRHMWSKAANSSKAMMT